MKLPDVSVLLYAINLASPQHAVAHAALKGAYESGDVALPWPVLTAFLRLTTRSGILPTQLTVEQALDLVHRWTDHPAARLIEPTPRHGLILGRLLVAAGRGGNLVPDAHLAALAIEHDAELLSFDRDFTQFAGLKASVLA
jgi:uncharacterized protein